MLGIGKEDFILIDRLQCPFLKSQKEIKILLNVIDVRKGNINATTTLHANLRSFPDHHPYFSSLIYRRTYFKCKTEKDSK